MAAVTSRIVQASYFLAGLRIGTMNGKFLTVKELAALLNLKESWIYDRTARNGPEVIPHTKFGRQVRFDIDSPEFRSWLKSHGVTAERTFPTALTA
jgi:excisionase family DNA binding protein